MARKIVHIYVQMLNRLHIHISADEKLSEKMKKRCKMKGKLERAESTGYKQHSINHFKLFENFEQEIVDLF